MNRSHLGKRSPGCLNKDRYLEYNESCSSMVNLSASFFIIIYSDCCSTNLSKQTLNMPCFMPPHTHREQQQARVHRTHKKRQKRKRKKDSERKTKRKTHMVRGLWRLSTEASGNELVCTELKLEFWNRAKRFLLSIPRKILASHTGTQTFENETQMTSVSHAELHANGRTIQKKKWCNDAGFNRRLTSKRKRERRKGKRKGWVDERNKENEGGENLLHGLQAGHSLLWTPPSRHLLIPLYLRKDKKK